jgi:excisionase family DNA binding protein
VDEVLTIEQAAAHIKMSERYVRRLVAERRIPFYKLGRAVRIKASDLDAYINAGRVAPLTAGDVWRNLGRAA